MIEYLFLFENVTAKLNFVFVTINDQKRSHHRNLV